MKTTLFPLILFALPAATPALAINKCMVAGKPVFQDAPCANQGETVGQSRDRLRRIEAYHRELDQLANQGYGMREEAEAQPPIAKAAPEPSSGPPKTREQAQAEQYAAQFREREAAERRNAEAAVRMKSTLEEIRQRCNSDPKQAPQVGMSDAAFRNCTIHGRLDVATQVVAIDRDGVPLRLYLYSNEPQRVYSVDGVVTAVR